MTKKMFGLGILVMTLVFGTTVVSCDNDTTTKKGNSGLLEGIWHGTLGEMTASIAISGKTYLITLDGQNFGRGNISYTSSTVTLKSTHMWFYGAWVKYVETVTGNFALSADTIILSNFTGIYSEVNGTWLLQ